MHKHSWAANRQHPYLKGGSIVLFKNPFKPRVSWSMVNCGSYPLWRWTNSSCENTTSWQVSNKRSCVKSVSSRTIGSVISCPSELWRVSRKVLIMTRCIIMRSPKKLNSMKQITLSSRLKIWGKTLSESEPEGVNFEVNSEDDTVLKVEEVAEEDEIESRLRPTIEICLRHVKEGAPVSHTAPRSSRKAAEQCKFFIQDILDGGHFSSFFRKLFWHFMDIFGTLFLNSLEASWIHFWQYWVHFWHNLDTQLTTFSNKKLEAMHNV